MAGGSVCDEDARRKEVASREWGHCSAQDTRVLGHVSLRLKGD
jgi:hypothetical protein